MERNQYLESDGLFWQSESHEWFNDNVSTQYAHKKSVLWGSGTQNDALKEIKCFVTRCKETGEYDRVMVDEIGGVIFDTKSLEDMGFQIDKMKVSKRFKIK